MKPISLSPIVSTRVPRRATGNTGLIAGLLVIGALAGRADAATFTVTNTNDSGAGSLRQAIISANTTTASDTITFNIGSGAKTIAPTTVLPAITRPLILNATTQPGFSGVPLIKLSGLNTSLVNGFTIGASACTVRGFVLSGWGGAAIDVVGSTVASCHIEGNLIGLNADATAADANNFGVLLEPGTKSNVIGGGGAGTSNYISGNEQAGIMIKGSNSNTITGNAIGTNGLETAAVPNGFGIIIQSSAKSNTIGGSTDALRNLISGNRSAAISITGTGTSSNKVVGNVIGLAADGSTAIPNFTGISIDSGASGNTIGGTGLGLNIISGNETTAIGISGSGTSANTVINNLIGLSSNGSSVVANQAGVLVQGGATGNVIGGANLGNVFCGGLTGVVLSGAGTNANSVIGNRIGTNIAGTAAVANVNGVLIEQGAQSNTIGGVLTGQKNTISGNAFSGVSVVGNGTDGNMIEGNLIGTDAGGGNAIPNKYGITVSGGARNTIIGGTASLAPNLISGNTDKGILIKQAGTDGTVIQQNIIGANGISNPGTASIPNGTGIQVDEDARDTVIGGTAANAGNLISGNHGPGIDVRGNAIGTIIQGNNIGTKIANSGPLPNGTGIFIEGNAQFTVVGSSKAVTDPDTLRNAGNIISYNSTNVALAGASTYDNTIRGNSINSSSAMAIDLNNDGPTANDSKDPDTGVNRLQNSPVITTVTSDEAGAHISGSLNSIPNENFTIDFYQNPDPNNVGGNRYRGNLDVTTNSSGVATFTFLDTNSPSNLTFTATATRDATGDTSEFAVPPVSFPNVAITAPATGSRVPGFTSIKGTASDPDGIQRVDVFLFRYSDGKFWDGTSWGGPHNIEIPNTYTAGNKSWTTTGTLPSSGGSDPNTSFTEGDYDIIAQAYDTTGKMTRTDSIVTVSYHVDYVYTGRAATCPYADGDACAAFVPGDPRNFFDARNWSPNGIPGSKDNATIGGGFDVALNTTDNTKGTILLGGLTLTGGTLHGASLSFAPTAGNSNTFTFTSGTLDVKTTTINAAAKLIFNGDSERSLDTGCIINNQGAATFDSSAPLRGIGNSIFNNLAGASFICTHDGTVFSNFNGGNVFNNNAGATFGKHGAFASTSGSSLINAWTFSNGGTIQGDTGLLEFNNGEPVKFNDKTIVQGTSTVLLSGGTLTFTGGTTINSTLQITGGNTAGTGTPIVASGGKVNWQGGTILKFNVNAGGQLNLSGDAIKDIDASGVINNSGAATLTGTGQLRGLGNSTFNNLAGASFTCNSDADFTNFNGGNKFVNASTANFVKAAGSDATTVDWYFNNGGPLHVAAGSLNLQGDGSLTGTVQADAGGSFRFVSGVYAVGTNARFTGDGYTAVEGGEVTCSAAVVSGSADAPRTFTVTGGKLTTSGTTGNFTPYGTLNWTGGTIGGKLTILSGSTLALSGDGLKDLDTSGVINNSGITTITGAGALRGLGNGTFNNLTGAQFQIKSDVPFLQNFNSGNVFNNNSGATLAKQTGTGTSTMSAWTLNNSGTVTAATGTLAFDDGEGLNFKDKGVINGAGQVKLLSGDITATGSTTVDAAFTQSGGNLLGSGAFSVSSTGSYGWTGGSILHLNIKAGSHFNISGTEIKQIHDTGVINNAGTANLSGTGAIQALGASTLNNQSGGSFIVASDADFTNFNAGNVFINATGASFTKSVGNTSASSQVDWIFNNSGAVTTSAGVLNLAGGGTNTSNITTNSGAFLRFNDAEYDLATGSVVGGTGKTQLISGTLSATGTATFGSNGNPTTFEISGGTLTTGTSGLNTAYGTVNWTGGSIGGKFTLATGSTFNVSGATTKEIAASAILSSSGTTNVSGTGAVQADGSSTFNNLNGATFNIASDANFTNFNGGNKFVNNTGASFNKTVGTISTASTIDWAVNGGGDVRAIQGVLALNGGGTLSGTLTATTPGIMRFTGGDFTLPSGAFFNSSGKTQVAGANLTCTAPVASGSTGAQHVLEVSSGKLTTSGSGTFTSYGALNFIGGVIGGKVTIPPIGAFNISGAGGKQLDTGAVVTNAGTTTLSGTLQSIGSVTFTNQSGATFKALSGGELTSFNGGDLFTNSGTLILGAPVATVNFVWNFKQTGTGTFAVDVNGKTAGQFDQLNIGGTASIAGTLAITKGSGYAPKLDEAIPVLTSGGARTGSFTTVTNSSISTTLEFTPIYNPNDVTLKVSNKVFSISGKISKSITLNGVQSERGLTGVTVNIVKNNVTVATTTTDSNGLYSVGNLPGGVYSIRPAQTGIVFDPVSNAVTLPTSGISGVSPNFVANFTTYSLTVNVVDGSNAPVSGVVVKLSGAKTATGTTNAKGQFIFDNLGKGTYTATPTPQSGFLFDQSAQTATLPTTGVPNYSPNGNVTFVRTASGALTIQSDSAEESETTPEPTPAPTPKHGSGTVF